jgi:hypothetical protein
MAPLACDLYSGSMPSYVRKAEDRLATLLDHMGFDPRDGIALRTPATFMELPAGATNLTLTPEASLKKINASPYVKKALSDGEVWLHPVEAASSRYIPDRSAFLSIKTLQNMAADAERGLAILTRHATGGFLGVGANENPYGRSYAGHFDARGDLARTIVQFYMLRDYRPNGSAAPSTDDLNRGLLGGTLFDVSASLTKGGGLCKLTCDVCSSQIYTDRCKHIPGTTIGMTDDEIALQTKRGIPEGQATFTMDDWHTGEISIVYNGAIPSAGTAFASARPIELAAKMMECKCCANDSLDCSCATKDKTKNGVCSCHADCGSCKDNSCGGLKTAMASEPEEKNMWTTEMKLQMGLLSTATDAECLAKFNAINAASYKMSTDLASQTEKVKALEAQAVATAETAFVTKFADKIDAALLANIKSLPNRDAIAEGIVKSTTPAKPPIGDPLKGTNLQAAPPAETPGEEATAASEVWRKGMGVFESHAAMIKASNTPPVKALEKMFGISLHPSELHQQYDVMAIENRKNYGKTV